MDGIDLGTRFHAVKEGKRSVRVSTRDFGGKLPPKTLCMLAVLRDGKLIAPLTFVGSCNHHIFEKWLQELLLPISLPDQTIILDNATFHKSEKVRKLIEIAKCELKYLPPLSPDLNQIEHQWFPIKNQVRKMSNSDTSFRERVDISVANSS